MQGIPPPGLGGSAYREAIFFAKSMTSYDHPARRSAFSSSAMAVMEPNSAIADATQRAAGRKQRKMGAGFGD
jgi:hypothetical protein